jgi:hypothetical protein
MGYSRSNADKSVIKPLRQCLGKEVLWVQNKKGWAYQGHDWHSGIMRECDMIMCLLMSQRSMRIYNVFQKSSWRLQGYIHAIQDSRVESASRHQQKQVLMTRFSRIHSRGIGYLHSCSRLKCTWVLMCIQCYSQDAHGVVQWNATMQCRQLLVIWVRMRYTRNNIGRICSSDNSP